MKPPAVAIICPKSPGLFVPAAGAAPAAPPGAAFCGTVAGGEARRGGAALRTGALARGEGLRRRPILFLGYSLVKRSKSAEVY
jgi:hypothetical protein